MAIINAKPPRALATSAAQGARSAGRLNSSSYSQDVANPQVVAAAIVAERFGLSVCLARLVCELAEIGGRLG